MFFPKINYGNIYIVAFFNSYLISFFPFSDANTAISREMNQRESYFLN